MNELLKAALVGTHRQQPPPLNTDSPTDQLVCHASEMSPEQSVLVRSGLIAIREMAGQLPIPVPALGVAPRETECSPTPRMTQLLSQVLSPESINLLPEYVGVLTKYQIHFPHSLLPVVLDFVQSQRRELLKPVLGKRGQWLATFNPAWNWVVERDTDVSHRLAELESKWNEGTFTERLQALRQARELDAAIGRQWLNVSFTKEKADYRRKFLEAFSIGLCEEDLPFIEQQLKDRADGVRTVARDLLRRLPESSASKRMLSRGTSVLNGTRNAAGELHLTLTIPQTIDDDWELDGLPDGIPNKPSVGRVAAKEIIAAIPPVSWLQQFQCPADEFILAAANADESDILFNGLRESFLRFPPIDSASIILLNAFWKWFVVEQSRNHWLGSDAVAQTLSLFAIMPPESTDQALITLLSVASARDQLPIVELFNRKNGAWSVALSKAYLKTTRNILANRSDGFAYRWCETLFPAAIGLNLDCLEEAMAPWTLNPELVRSVRTLRVGQIEDQLRRFGEVLKTRQQFHTEAENIVKDQVTT